MFELFLADFAVLPRVKMLVARIYPLPRQIVVDDTTM